MARQRMITRTVSTTIYTCMVVELATKAVKECEVSVVSADTMTTKKIEQAIQYGVPTDHKFVMVTGERVETEIYGMTEADFMKHAVRVER